MIDKTGMTMFFDRSFGGRNAMIHSMTGFGKAEVTLRKRKVRIEVSSVNNRFLDVSIRLPKIFSDYENRVRKVVTQQVARGKLILLITTDGNDFGPDSLVLNQELAAFYYKMFTDLKQKLKLAGDIEISHFAALPDLFGVAPATDASETDIRKLIAGVKKALRHLDQMRAAEGRVLAQDMTKRVGLISRGVDQIVKYQPKSLQRYRRRLTARIKEIIGDDPLALSTDSKARLRLDMEVALMAEKADVTEECVRLRSHCRAFLTALRARGDVGKRLNFILQEMNREANTIGSKAILYEVSAEVISVREEIEKLREQVQNIE